MSVYVPDDLWEEVQKEEDFKLSAFVQQALRQKVTRRSARPYARIDEALREERATARARVAQQMAEAYRAGYRMGLEFSRQLPWRAFVDLAEGNYDLPTWRANFDHSGYEIVDRSQGWTEGGEYIDWDNVMDIASDNTGVEMPADDERIPLGLPAEGFADALRDVWQRTDDVFTSDQLANDEASDSGAVATVEVDHVGS